MDVTEKIESTKPAEENQIGQEDTFAFKLFSTARNAVNNAENDGKDASTVEKAPEVQLISLAEDDHMQDAASLLPPPERPLSYYIATPATAAEKARYVSAAISGEDIIQLSKMPWPGMSYEWRIISTTSSQSTKLRTPGAVGSSSTRLTDAADQSEHTFNAGRTRLGKKSRIKLRIKLQTKVAKQKEKEEAEKAKEAHLRDKKTRVNRAKQLKKREKARLAKGDEEAGTTDQPGADEDKSE